MITKVVTGACLVLTLIHFGLAKESWGYIAVRPGAKMFYWLYFANMTNNAYTNFPLVVWLQGGPGESSTGVGNFVEIGPLDMNLNPRNTSWVKNASLLFVDSPVGTGYSYVENKTLLCKSDKEIADDLFTFLTHFMSKFPEFQTIPVYIFSESYATKTAVYFADQLIEALKASTIEITFKGLILGSPWISPLDDIGDWSSFLYSMSYIGSGEVDKLNISVDKVMKAMDVKNYTQAFDYFKKTEIMILNQTAGISFDNVQYDIKAKNKTEINELLEDAETNPLLNFHKYDEKKLFALMNTVIREKLAYIDKNVTWGGQKKDVFSKMENCFLKPATKIVESLLNNSSIPIVVYNGQFDLTANTLGVLDWMHHLDWPGQDQFKKKNREIVYAGPGVSIFHKSFKNLHYYSILKAGKMVPYDNPEAGLKLLNLILAI